MRMPNMDTKRIKRLDDDKFTIDALSSFKAEDSALCDHCAVDKCKIRNYITRTDDTFDLKVKSCGEFMPALGFSVLQGLDLPVWNTVRVGEAWYSRVVAGQKVAIIDTKNNKPLGYRVVCEVYKGSLSDILTIHAHKNHAIMDEIRSGKTDKKDSATRLMRILKNAYGTNIASADRKSSVIYLQKIND